MSDNAASLGLGIDAGGTFTDGAIVNLKTGDVLSKGKTHTAKEDLPGSIRRCLEGLDHSLLHECIVAALSTTFATNAIVESRAARAGILLLGYDEYDVARVQAEHKIAVPGSHNIRGREIEPLDERALLRGIRRLVQADRVEAVAVSGMGGVLNPAHEIAARNIIRKEANIPVVCGHELSMELGAIRRATTAYLNASLLPVVVHLIHALEAELRAAGVTAPILVVRSDGTLMSLADALAHPIHTIFSGPAASAIGALYLSGRRDGMVVDIGGTTTDILFAENGDIAISPGGCKVNSFDVSTPMVQTHTLGLGGDSHVRRDAQCRLTIGPERVVPVAMLASLYPEAVQEMEESQERRFSNLCQPVDFYLKGWADPDGVSAEERKILDALKDGPRSAEALSRICGCVHPSLLQTDRLVRRGCIMRSGLTPTDVLLAAGTFRAWDPEAARLAVRLYASDLWVSPEKLSDRVLDATRSKLTRAVLTAALGEASRNGLADSILAHASPFVELSVRLAKPIIGIGAPVSAYLPEACRTLGADPVIPEHAEVANAVGAVAGRVVVKAKAVISPGMEGFAVHTPLEYSRLGDLESAEEFAENRLRQYLTERVEQEYGGLMFRYDLHTDRRSAESADGRILIESIIHGTAVCISMPQKTSSGSG